MGMRASSGIGYDRIAAFVKVVPSIIYGVLRRAPTPLEFIQALIAKGRPAKFQGFKSLVAVVLDCLPHNQVVAAKMQKPFIRGAKFLNRCFAVIKIYGTGNWHIALTRQHN